MGTAEASQTRLGKKELTTLHAIGQSLALGPIFSAAPFIGFTAYATRIEDVAPAAPVDLGL